MLHSNKNPLGDPLYMAVPLGFQGPSTPVFSYELYLLKGCCNNIAGKAAPEKEHQKYIQL